MTIDLQSHRFKVAVECCWWPVVQEAGAEQGVARSEAALTSRAQSGRRQVPTSSDASRNFCSSGVSGGATMALHP
jgi:hypothetical protein